MTAPTKPNAELAYRVLDQIDAHPEQWKQSLWISRPDGADCGTAGCFAGWVCMLSGDQPDWFNGDASTSSVVLIGERAWSFIDDRAIDLLNIEREQARDLFHADNTREELGRQVAAIFGPRPGGAA